jgi:putative ABC transport system permease protein
MYEPSLIGMLWAVGMVAIAIGIASWQRLGLTKTLAIASGRSVIQLLALGVLLSLIFALDSPLPILALLVGMVTLAAVVARSRIDRDLPRLLGWVWLSVFASGLISLSYVCLLVIRFEPWYDPRYWVPLAGVVVGNSMTAASIAGERLVSALRHHRTEVETHLSLGATPAQAVATYRQAAIKAGLIPTLNGMTIAGLVTLPDIMAGQILAGAEPLTAAIYQIFILFMLVLATLIASWVVTYGIVRQFFNEAMQLVVR